MVLVKWTGLSTEWTGSIEGEGEEEPRPKLRDEASLRRGLCDIL